jgi:hypothetical protein
MPKTQPIYVGRRKFRIREVPNFGKRLKAFDAGGHRTVAIISAGIRIFIILFLISG